MEKSIIKKWEENKHKLKEHFKNNFADYTYKDLVIMIIEKILNDEDDDYGDTYSTDIHEIDDGGYQGTLLYLIPKKTIWPDEYEYLITTVHYGSCSYCDTLSSINSWTDEIATIKQVNDYITLCLHLIQKMKHIYTHDSEEYSC